MPDSPPAPRLPFSRSLPWTLARSQLRRRRAQNLSTVLGTAVGIMVLIAALSLTNGFTAALINATLRATPHLTLTHTEAGGLDPQLEQTLSSSPLVAAYAPFLADKGLLTRPAREGMGAGVDFATLFGVGTAAGNVLQLSDSEKATLAHLKGGEIMLGGALAQSLGAYEGQEVRLLNSAQHRASLKVAGIFRTGNYVIDSAYAFVPLSTLQGLQAQPGNITGYEVRLHDPQQASTGGVALVRQLNYNAIPWQNLYGSLLDQMKLQKQVIAFVVFLIVVVAAFGIANVLTLTVFEKAQDIAILRAIGASRGDILRAFMLQGLLLGFAGLLLGNLLGLGISAYFMWRPFQIPGDLYFITSLPVEVRASDLLWVNALGLVTILLSTLLPARRAADIEPGRVIR